MYITVAQTIDRFIDRRPLDHGRTIVARRGPINRSGPRPGPRVDRDSNVNEKDRGLSLLEFLKSYPDLGVAGKSKHTEQLFLL